METGSATGVNNFYQHLWSTDNGKMTIQKFCES